MIVMEVPDIPTTDIRGGPPSAEPRNRTSNQNQRGQKWLNSKMYPKLIHYLELM